MILLGRTTSYLLTFPTFLFMNPHGWEWKIRGWKFQLSLSQRFLCPLTSCLFPGILFPKFSPNFTMLRSMDFISVTCSLSKGMGSHWFPQQTPFPSDLRLKQVTGGASRATLRYFRDFQSGNGTHSPSCKRLLTTFHSL